MKMTTMTLSKKSLSIFPQDWCAREGLAQGGVLNVFDLGKAGLLIRPVKPPSPKVLAALLRRKPAGPQTPEAAAAIVERALRQVRRG